MKPMRSMILATVVLMAAVVPAHGADPSEAAPAKVGAGPAQSREAQREAIRRDRQALEARRVQEETACYKKFVVESCLQEIRTRTRAQDTALRQREVALNDADRRDKAASRLQAIEDKKKEQQAQQAAGERPAGMTGTSRQPARARTSDQAARSEEARQRATQQQQRQAAHEADKARRASEEPTRIEQSRARYEAKQQAAQERRARREKANAEAAAAGRTPPSALPPVPASAP